MSATTVRLLAYAAALATAFVVAFAVGRAVGPIGRDATGAPHSERESAGDHR